MAELTPEKEAELCEFARWICDADTPRKYDPDEIFEWLKRDWIESVDRVDG